MGKYLKKILLIFFAVIFDAAGSVIFVDITAPGGGDGSSWVQAYNNLDSALAAASASEGADEIWIADGIYKPSQIYAPSGVIGGASGLADPRLMTFNLPGEVQLYGGFSGNETSLDQRNPELYVTILSGDILGNDLSDPSETGYLDSKADNVWHVVTAGNDVSSTGVSATLDGLRIIKGFAAGPNSVVSGAVNYTHESGGGLYARFGSGIVIHNVRFHDNLAGMNPAVPKVTPVGGAGIFGDGTNTLFTISNTEFVGNFAGLQPLTVESSSVEGGGLMIIRNASADISMSLFADNGAVARGGAIGALTGPLGHLRVTDSIILRNEVFGGKRGGITLFSAGAGIRAANTPLVIDGVQFIENKGVSDGLSGGTIGGGLMIEPAANSSYEQLVVNSEFIDNKAFLGGGMWMNALNTLASIENTTFVGNEASMGGAIFKEGGKMNISNTSFIHNRAEIGGGAIGHDYSVFDVLVPNAGPTQILTIINSEFVGNSTEGSSTSEVSNFTRFYIKSLIGADITFSYSSGGGTIINMADASTVITGSSFVNNDSNNSSGGAILNGGAKYVRDVAPSVERVTGGFFTINNSTFINDRSDINGGVISSQLHSNVVTPANRPAVTLSESTLKNNEANGAGGTLYLDDSTANITGNSFYTSNDAALADQIYGRDSLINGIPTSNSAGVIVNLKSTNSLQRGNDMEDFYFE